MCLTNISRDVIVVSVCGMLDMSSIVSLTSTSKQFYYLNWEQLLRYYCDLIGKNFDEILNKIFPRSSSRFATVTYDFRKIFLFVEKKTCSGCFGNVVSGCPSIFHPETTICRDCMKNHPVYGEVTRNFITTRFGTSALRGKTFTKGRYSLKEFSTFKSSQDRETIIIEILNTLFEIPVTDANLIDFANYVVNKLVNYRMFIVDLINLSCLVKTVIDECETTGQPSRVGILTVSEFYRNCNIKSMVNKIIELLDTKKMIIGYGNYAIHLPPTIENTQICQWRYLENKQIPFFLLNELFCCESDNPRLLPVWSIYFYPNDVLTTIARNHHPGGYSTLINRKQHIKLVDGIIGKLNVVRPV